MSAAGLFGARAPGLMRPAGQRLLREIPLRSAQRGQGARRSVFADLNLTSMVDMLTILVVFLLQMFAASGDLAVSRGVRLPEARHHGPIEPAPIVSVSADVVTLDGAPVADTQELLRGESADWSIPRLRDDLVVLKNNFKLLHQEPDAWRGQVLLMVDRGVDFKALKKVLYTCAAAGYFNLNFAVQQR